MITYNDFRSIWFSAQEYAPEQHDLYIAERGWQSWMDEFGEDDTSSIIRVLDAIYTMSHGGIAAIRSITGMSQVNFSAAYGIPRRSVENWERDSSETREAREAPSYTQMLLGYAVLTDQLARITAARSEE